MISYSSLDYYVKQAFEKDEFFDLLMGYKGYDCSYPKMFNVDAVTDWYAVVKSIHSYYEETKNPTIIFKFEEAIKKMTDSGLYCLWAALYVYWTQMELENKNLSSFEIDKEIGKIIKGKIDFNKKRLSEEKISLGDEHSDYFYHDIIRVFSIYKKDWGKELL